MFAPPSGVGGLHPDHLGTSTFLTDYNGNAYQFFLNLPFGETMAEQLGSNYYNTPYKFNGKELDEETGLYYYGARYYDPRVSIWLSIDPLAEKMPSWSPYSFCFNNPMHFVDPDGKAPTDWYRNNATGKMKWIEGSGNVSGYTNKGYNVSDQSYGKNKSDHLIMDGTTKQITINGNVVADFNKSSDGDKHGGFAFADGGNAQDPSSLDKGGRDVQWIDFKGMLEILTLLLGTDRESPAAGKVTPDTKTKSAIDAVGNTADAIKAGTEGISKKPDMIYTHKDNKDPNKNVQVSREVYEAQQKKKNE